MPAKNIYCNNYRIIQKNKSLTIIDWDDTIFPTTWLISKKTNYENVMSDEFMNKHIVMFSELDNEMCKLFGEILKYSKVVIVTNAMLKWIDHSLKLLPNLSRIINNHVSVISAKEKYGEIYPKNIYLRKAVVFKDLSHNYDHMISIGDAQYEYDALVNIYGSDENSKNKIFKTLKFIKYPSFDEIMEQTQLLRNAFGTVFKKNCNSDILFINKNA